MGKNQPGMGWESRMVEVWTQNMEKCWESMEWFGKTEHGEQNENWKSSKIMIDHLVIMMEDKIDMVKSTLLQLKNRLCFFGGLEDNFSLNKNVLGTPDKSFK
jgi:hypothetical protein